jgi:hypothetical protein
MTPNMCGVASDEWLGVTLSVAAIADAGPRCSAFSTFGRGATTREPQPEVDGGENK